MIIYKLLVEVVNWRKVGGGKASFFVVFLYTNLFFVLYSFLICPILAVKYRLDNGACGQVQWTCAHVDRSSGHVDTNLQGCGISVNEPTEMTRKRLKHNP